MEADALVREYLGRLEVAARVLPADRQRELTTEISEHIDAALAEAPDRDEVTVRNVLERIGEPDEIVAAEAEPAEDVAGTAGPMSPAPALAAAQPTGRHIGVVEIAAVLVLIIGSFVLPVIGPIIGLALVWLSTSWTTREKVIATAIVGLLLIVPVLLLMGVGAGSWGEGGVQQ